MLEYLGFDVSFLYRLILIPMEDYSDLDTSSESEYESEQESVTGSNSDTDEVYENLEPELSKTIHDEFENAPWNPEAQLKAQLNTARLARLHADIKARAQLPNLPYQKLHRSWPPRPFDVRILLDYVQHPIHYFELFWDSKVWNILVENTNAYAQYKEARNKGNKEQKSRWWKAVTLYEMCIFIALLIYISIVSTSSINSYWNKSRLTIHKLIEYITFFRFEQIKRYFHVSPPPTFGYLPRWHTKLDPLADLLRTKFQAYVILGQNVSFDEIIVLFTRRSKHTLKMKNKLVNKGFKIWALCDCGYL